MTPPLRWVFLLALVGRYAASVPASVTGNACALLCHPSASSSPEGVCEHLAAQSVLDQARVIVSRCLNLCDRRRPPFVAGVNCQALRSLLGDLRGCRCPYTAATPIGADILPLVNGLADDAVDAISHSAHGGRAICELREALLLDIDAEEIGPAADCTPDRLPTKHAKPDARNIERPPVDLDGSRGSLDSGRKTTTDSSSEEVDWDLWCMSQCNNGRGGNACRCDIIP